MRSTWHNYMQESIKTNNIQDNFYATNFKRDNLIKS